MIPFKLPEIDWNQKPNHREKIIFALALLIFFGAFLKSCWVPSRRALQNVQEQMAQVESQKTELAQAAHINVSTIPKAEEFDILGDEKGRFVGSLKEVEKVLGYLSDPTLLKGLDLKKSTFSEVEREGSLAKRSAELELVGSLSALGHYIEAVESLPTPLLIESFSILASDGKVTAQIKGSLYGKE